MVRPVEDVEEYNPIHPLPNKPNIMSKVTYIRTKDKHEDTSIEQGIDVHAELLNNDIDELAKAEEQGIDDNYDFGEDDFGYLK